MVLDKKKFTLQILSVVGLALAIKLALIYYVANYVEYALPSFCSINEFVDCDGAARTTLSQFLGIPLAYWGIFFYLIILFLTVVDKLQKFPKLKFLEVFVNPMAYITTLGTIAFGCSMLLAGFSFFKIHKLCLLCLITYFIDLFIALVASSFNFKNFYMSFKTTVLDFIKGARLYTKTFIVLLLFAVGLLSYSQITYNFIPHMKAHRSIMKYKNMTFNPYRVKGNDLGPKDGTVVIDLYSDFVCPMCYVHNIMLHNIVKDYKNVRVVHHNFPFDKECNPYIMYDMHPNACFMSRAAIAARHQGNYWEMSSLLYEHQPKSKQELVGFIQKLNFDEEQFFKDMDSQETAKEIAEELKNADVMGLDATPTMFVNGEKFVGLKSYYMLQDIMDKKGGRRK